MKLTRDAELGLDDIEAFSRTRWGAERTRRYMAEFRAQLKALRRDAGLGVRRLDVNATALCLRSGRHMIFYKS